MIKDIYKVQFMKNHFSYVGTLRNQFIFKMDEYVFFSIAGGGIVRGQVVGIEKSIDQNPDYTYKVTIPVEALKDSEKAGTIYQNGRAELDCQYMFKSISAAKESAIKNLEHMYKLQKKEIDLYFDGFKDVD